jgi:hypothetical protein
MRRTGFFFQGRDGLRAVRRIKCPWPLNLIPKFGIVLVVALEYEIA